MDIDVVMARIMKARAGYIAAPDQEEAYDHLVDVVDAFDDLDDWLARGGFLPSRWSVDRY